MKRVLLIEEVSQVAEHLKGLLAREQEVELAGVQQRGEDGIAQATAERPDVVLIDALMQGKLTGAQIAQRVRAASPGTRIVMVTVPRKPIDPEREAAVDAVFVLPGGANELGHALGLGSPAQRKGGKGQVVAVYSASGGTGKSTIAVNLACALRRDGATLALVDGVMQFGTIRHLMGAPAGTRSIVDLPTGQAMRASLTEVLWEGPAGVNVLLAPAKPEEADLVAPSEIANAMTLLADAHDHVIADAPSRLADDALAVLDAADVVLIVVTYTAQSIANARAAVDVFDALGYGSQKPVLIVVSHADMKIGRSKESLEQSLGLPVAAEIPNDWKLAAESGERHIPFVIGEPAAPAAQAVQRLAASVVSQQRR
ncbi:hypothetical protein BH18CHL2_BH18CHL2_13050 [soil metagenome]